MYRDYSIDRFTKELASDSSAPGGGCAAALSAATAASLVSMVASFTIGKKGYEDCQDEMVEIIDLMEEYRQFFIEAMDTDAESYKGVLDAYRLPRATEDEKKERDLAIEENLYKAAMAPLKVAEKSLEIFEYAKNVVERGNKNVISDGAVAALFARAAVKASLHNVEINGVMLKDPVRKSFLLTKVSQLERDVDTLEKDVLSRV